MQGGESSTLEFDAVQRGDAQMEQKLNRLLRACIESGIRNPICSIHDQGAGGNGNVLKVATTHYNQIQLIFTLISNFGPEFWSIQTKPIEMNFFFDFIKSICHVIRL